MEKTEITEQTESHLVFSGLYSVCSVISVFSVLSSHHQLTQLNIIRV